MASSASPRLLVDGLLLGCPLLAANCRQAAADPKQPVQDDARKCLYDVLDPNDSLGGNWQVRYSLLWEYSPMQFLQGRFRLRSYDGITKANAQIRDVFFAELHGYFCHLWHNPRARI